MPRSLGSKTIYDHFPDKHVTTGTEPPRARGAGFVSAKKTVASSALDDLCMSGCVKLLFSRATDRVETVMLNTSGGLTSGDRIALEAKAQAGANLSLTTQAAERAYRADTGHAEVRTNLQADDNAAIFWLPQELILFEAAQLDRKLQCRLTDSSRALIVEPVIFGRHAMGEHLRNVQFRDEINITRNGQPLLCDVVDLTGDVQTTLARSVTGASAGAMATIVYIAPDAEAQMQETRVDLPKTAGASLIQDDVLVVRALASDSLNLRRFLVPLMERLTHNSLPVCWRL